MTPLARAGGIALSAAAHVVAGVLLLTLSAPEWTRPLFVDLMERAESIGGGAARAGAPSGQSTTRSGAEAPPAPREFSTSSRRALPAASNPRSESVTSSGTSSTDAAARVQPPPAPTFPPDPRPMPQPESTPAAPRPAVSPPPTASSQPSASASPPTRDQPIAAPPGAPSIPAISSDSRPAPWAEPGRSSMAGGEARGAEGRGGDARARGEVRGDAGSSAGGAPGSVLALGTGGGAIPPEYGPYLQRFRRHVQESLVYPLAARRQSLRGTVELDVFLDPAGRVRDVRVARSSSYGILDDAAVDTLRRLDPLPLPESLPRRPLLIRLPLVFDLR